MKRSFPIRAKSHQLAELSERNFRNALPTSWTAEKPVNDYGVDLRLDLFEGDRATGLEILVQLKATAKSSGGNTETVRLKTSTYNYLRKKLCIAMLVKYVKGDDDAYWLLFSDIPYPPQNQETFSIHIPKVNRLSCIDWMKIQTRVRSATDEKLAYNRRRELARTE